jgi:hypothetical protein
MPYLRPDAAQDQICHSKLNAFIVGIDGVSLPFSFEPTFLGNYAGDVCDFVEDDL